MKFKRRSRRRFRSLPRPADYRDPVEVLTGVNAIQEERVEWLKDRIFEQDRYKGGHNSPTASEFKVWEIIPESNDCILVHSIVGLREQSSIPCLVERFIRVDKEGGMILVKSDGEPVKQEITIKGGPGELPQRKEVPVLGTDVVHASPSGIGLKLSEEERRQFREDLERARTKNTSAKKYRRVYRR